MTDLIRIAICNPSPIIRCGIRSMLSETPDLEIVFEAATHEEVITNLNNIQTDIIIVNSEETSVEYFRCLSNLQESLPELKVITLCDCTNKRPGEKCLTNYLITQSIDLGVKGFQCKPKSTAEEIISSIRKVQNGDIDLSACVTQILLDNIHETKTKPLELLSTREQQVLNLIAKGKSNSDIADNLYISTRTVKFHVSSIFSKLKVKNRTQAAMWFL